MSGDTRAERLGWCSFCGASPVRNVPGEMKHSLCGMSFADIEDFNRHVGVAAGPTFTAVGPLCVALPLRERNKRPHGAQYQNAKTGASQPATGAGSAPVKRNTPGRKKVYASNADRQRAYRERKRRGPVD